MPENPSLPKPLLASLSGLAGYSESDFVDAHAQPAPTSIRCNTQKLLPAAIPYPHTPVPWCQPGLYLAQRPAFVLDPLLHAGGYYVQEAGSQFLWQILAQLQMPTNGRVLDLCAAPGGKSTLLASWFTQGLVLANEVIKTRNAVLVENLTKWGGNNWVVSCNDPVHFQRLPSFFDLMVIDAPCSGSGLMRRDPEAIEQWSPQAVLHCQQRQQRILADALPALAPGGVLIYSTCSYSPQENEDICDFLLEMGELESVSLQLQPGWNIVATESGRHLAHGYRFYPHRTSSEGFFCAVFRKKGLGGSMVLPAPALTPVPKAEEQLIKPWLKPEVSEQSFFWKQQSQYLLVPKNHTTAIAQLQQHLYLRMAGTLLGLPKAKGWVPEHSLAVSALISQEQNKVELNLTEAIAYLQKREDLQIADCLPGWVLVTYEGLGLGWIKHLGHRINNYYPAAWRILKRV